MAPKSPQRLPETKDKGRPPAAARQFRLHWTPELDEELTSIYHQAAIPKAGGQRKISWDRVKELWDTRFPQFPLTKRALNARWRRLEEKLEGGKETVNDRPPTQENRSAVEAKPSPTVDSRDEHPHGAKGGEEKEERGDDGESAVGGEAEKAGQQHRTGRLGGVPSPRQMPLVSDEALFSPKFGDDGGVDGIGANRRYTTTGPDAQAEDRQSPPPSPEAELNGTNDDEPQPSPSRETKGAGPEGGTSEGSQSDVDFEQKLREEFHNILREVKGEEGIFDQRKSKPTLPGGIPNRRLLAAVDRLLEEGIEADPSPWNLNCLVYAAARLAESRSRNSSHQSRTKRDRLREREKEIRTLRRKIGWLFTEVERRAKCQKATKNQAKNLRALERLFGKQVHQLRQLRVLREQQLALLKIRTHQARQLRKTIRRDEQRFAFETKGPRCLEDGNPKTDLPCPTADQITEFWSGVVGVTGECDLQDPAYTAWKEELKADQVGTVGEGEGATPDWAANTVWEAVCKKTRNWRAPGPDAIKAYWWKAFPSAKEWLRGFIGDVLNGSRSVPRWMVKGRTVLIPKPGCEGKPEQYRPIACLNTSYKLLTSIIAHHLSKHVVEKNILPDEQFALRKGRRGCIDALLVDSMICTDSAAKRRNLSVAWIDFKKAYDRVPFKVVKDVLNNIGAPESLQKAISGIMENWATVFEVGKPATKVDLDYRRGLFQGDSLSPLLFCLCIAPVSKGIRSSSKGYGVAVGPPITHTFYMDDLKIYCHNEKELRRVVAVATRVAIAVGMELGLTKCAEAHKVQKTGERREKTLDSVFRQAEPDSPYVYLGVTQVIHPTPTAVFERLNKEYERRLHKIWSSELSGKYKVRATNVYGVALFRYYFCTLKWSLGQLKALDKLTRRVIRQHKSHHYSAATERLYLPRDEGGRGFASLLQVWENEVVSTVEYVLASEVSILRQLRENWVELNRRNKPTPLQWATEVLKRHELPQFDGPVVSPPGSIREDLKKSQLDKLRSALESKTVHGVFFSECRKRAVDQPMTHLWLRDGRLQSGTESLVIAAQDGVIQTRAYQTRIEKKKLPSSRCRLCNKASETLGHLLSSCGKMAWTLYKARHDRVLYQVVLALAKKHCLSLPNNMLWTVNGWHGVGVVENTEWKLSIDISNPTIQAMTERRPDLLVFDKSQRQITIIEIACAWDPLVSERETEKRNKYQAFARDLATQNPGWKVSVSPWVFGDLGLIVGLRKEIQDTGLLEGKELENLIRNCQREVLCSAVRIIRSSLART